MTTPFNQDLRSLARSASAGAMEAGVVALRVKIDILIASGVPSEADMVAFLDLATAVIPRVDDLTALTIAGKLATWPHTPDRIKSMLFTRDGRVAAALLTGSLPLPEGAVLEELASQGHIDVARAIAGRADLTAPICQMLVERDDAGIDRALAANGRVKLPRAAMDLLVTRARTDRFTAELLLARPELSQTDIAPLYFLADANRRQAIRAALEALNNVTAARHAPMVGEQVWQELLDLAGSDAVAALGMLAWRLGAGAPLAAVLVRDSTREAAALALAALGASVEMATRFLIRLGDEAACSVKLIFAHVDLMRTTRPGTAVRILAAVSDDAGLRLALAGPRQASEHQPFMAEGGTSSRPAAPGRQSPRRTLAGTVDRALRRDQS